MHGHAQGIEISVEQRPKMTIETAVCLGVTIVEIDTAGWALPQDGLRKTAGSKDQQDIRFKVLQLIDGLRLVQVFERLHVGD